MEITIRPIKPTDNKAMAALIRKVMEEFGVDRPGTVYTDPTTDHLFELFSHPGSFYFVIESDGVIQGGCGVYPTKNLPKGYAELVKLYFGQALRGKGLAEQIMVKCFEKAKELNYSHLYIESLPELKNALKLYIKVGFQYIDTPLGDSGHQACDIWMSKTL